MDSWRRFNHPKLLSLCIKKPSMRKYDWLIDWSTIRVYSCDGCVCFLFAWMFDSYDYNIWFHFRCALNLGWRGEAEVIFLLVRVAWRKIDLEPAHQSVVAYVLMCAHEKSTCIQENKKSRNRGNVDVASLHCRGGSWLKSNRLMTRGCQNS